MRYLFSEAGLHQFRRHRRPFQSQPQTQQRPNVRQVEGNSWAKVVRLGGGELDMQRTYYRERTVGMMYSKAKCGK